MGLTESKNTAKLDAMGNSVIVRRSHTNSAVAEHDQRLRMVEIRDRIFESRVLDLAVAMAVTGKDLRINQQSGELEGEEMLDQKVRQGYITMLAHKLISNAQIPKEIASEPDFSKWVDVIAEMDKEAENDS